MWGEAVKVGITGITDASCSSPMKGSELLGALEESICAQDLAISRMPIIE